MTLLLIICSIVAGMGIGAKWNASYSKKKRIKQIKSNQKFWEESKNDVPWEDIVAYQQHKEIKEDCEHLVCLTPSDCKCDLQDFLCVYQHCPLIEAENRPWDKVTVTKTDITSPTVKELKE